MEKGFERRPLRTGAKKNEMSEIQEKIKMLKNGINLIEQQIESEVSQEEITKLKNALYELKNKLVKEELKETGLRQDESLAEYSPALDEHIIKNETYEINSKKEKLENELTIIEKDESFVKYTKNYSRFKSLEDHITNLKAEIEEMIKSGESKEEMDSKISELRIHETEMINVVDLLEELLKDQALQEKIKKASEIDNKMTLLQNQLSSLHKTSESDQRKRNHTDATFSDN